MKCLSENVVSTTIADLTIEALERCGHLISINDSDLCARGDWQVFVASLWICNQFVGAARVERKNDNSIIGGINIFRTKDLTSNHDLEMAGFGPAAQVEFLLPEVFDRSGSDLVVKSCGSVDEELVQSVLYEFIVQSRAEMTS